MYHFSKYKDLTDEEIVSLYQNGNENAADEILHRYSARIRSIAGTLYLAGGEIDDLIQEGRFGLYQALKDYREEKGSFSSFAYICIQRAMFNAVQAENRKKHAPLNGSVSLDDKADEALSGSAGREEYKLNPEHMFLDQEKEREIRCQIEDSLSDMEKEVFKLLLEGQDYRQIAEHLHISAKSVDNARSRIRSKARKILMN